MVVRYEARDVTPELVGCDPNDPTDACPGVYRIEDGYLINGEVVDPSQAVDEKGVSLANKVGPNEVLIRVPRKIIDERLP